MRDSNKKPVLTSPWKIGVFVAMMLMVTSFAVGYYITHVYNIDLTWLKNGDSKWIIDSYKFFKELYPLAAGVVLISLFSYFLIASSVRRYKYYLASGQDYRKMISLADSIDDLTNPAQIAKLSDFPELQSILRNYGDQIKDISEEMTRMGEEEKSVDLEMEIDSILSGNDIQETIIEGRWWASLVRKISSHIADHNEELESIRRQIENNRKINGQTSLSIGRILEYAEGSNGDILEIVRSLGGLNSAAKQLADNTTGNLAVSGQNATGGAITGTREIEEALERICEYSRVLDSFAEENNGLALNIALMAARGEISEHSLAQFAEKLRGTAERFNRLSRESADAVGILKRNINASAKNRDSSAVVGIDTGGISACISDISSNIEKASHSLQDRVINLGNELEALDRNLHAIIEDKNTETTRQADEEACEEEIEYLASGDKDFVTFGEDKKPSSEDTGLVIDHGKIWEGEQDEAIDPVGQYEADMFDHESARIGEQEELEKISIMDNYAHVGEQAGIGDEPAVEEVEESLQEISLESSNAVDLPDGSVEDDDIYEIPESAEIKESSGPHEGGDWMEMPGHQWVKIGSEEAGSEGSSPTGSAEYFKPEQKNMIGEGQDSPADSLERVTDAIRLATGQNISGKVENVPAGQVAGLKEEEVYDLFELGAVEYVEKT
ncbi:MAG: methyl-accepting chemotaxis protein [Candidatus Krumholzibacteriota bacterium]|nr:methyl-accepting chemotaxis protein [Candidatus Krumholzibacteriota bacterium]